MSCCPPSQTKNVTPQAASFLASDEIAREWVVVPEGRYFVGGSDLDANPADGEGPPRTVLLKTFAIAATAVTNAEFARFVEATGYRTEAEQLGWSYVFHDLVSPASAKRVRQWPTEAPWWHVVDGACWRWPGGRGSHLKGRYEHPVVHVSWHDAQAYCRWSGTRLPTEAEWEVAARGGRVGSRYPWGDELTPGGTHMCNIWQGEFPSRDTADDGYHGTCPVRSFPPNDLGIYEASGNAWEWCNDWWTTQETERSGIDPLGPDAGAAKVMRGGSFLCHESYCNRYRLAARTSNTPDSASSNIGFRVVQA